MELLGDDGQFEVIGCKQSDEYDANINHKVYELLNVSNDNNDNNNDNSSSSSVNQRSCQLHSILKSNEILKRNIKFNFNTITSLSTSSPSFKENAKTIKVF